ncbi:Fe-S protein assembly co-chaperone HscB [Microbulbifer sp. 2205BS26-8]|uniref:Fe-S protein assembly co-chaperone HscB n=1 Tax=Microbulbifer sp. 2205BS26-8 TaxID=3064386 RepID=UPI00273F9B33|nr:Fe-S protein assembly co-chaperone HscB [Microbulbifer sp. 2205BS26-8]MDP5210078.1 Fe-S protein assembly co-chaperone HscB [Microbulbifer sp. 2205BS26-8]
MTANLTHFEIFGLEPVFALDRSALTARYRELQREFHPDKYASKSEREQLLAVQMAAQINEAHAVLQDPVQRAAYLLELAGVEVSPEQTTADVHFLMQQMQLRERLEAVCEQPDPTTALEALAEEVGELYREAQARFAEVFTAGNLVEAKDSLCKLQFLVKLQAQVEMREADLFDDD